MQTPRELAQLESAVYTMRRGAFDANAASQVAWFGGFGFRALLPTPFKTIINDKPQPQVFPKRRSMMAMRLGPGVPDPQSLNPKP